MGYLDEITKQNPQNPNNTPLQNPQPQQVPWWLLWEILKAPFAPDSLPQPSSTEQSGQIFAAAEEQSRSASPSSWAAWWVPPVQPPQQNLQAPQQPEKKKKSNADFWRIFGSIWLAWVVLFSAFIAYVVFNPDQAQFFISLWINPQDIKNLLGKLVDYSFWLLTAVMSIISLIFLFTAFATKKEYSKKKTIATIISIFSIIVLFWVISFWAWLVTIIWATDYVNTRWNIIVRDVDLMKSEKFKDGLDEVTTFDNVIWPVTLQYDLSANARIISKAIEITSYAIDFDWDWTEDKVWVNPEKDTDIIFTFDKKKSYVPKWKYVWNDKVTWKEKEYDMELPVITIIGLAIQSEIDDRQWWKRVTIDVSDLKKLWRMDFYLEEQSWLFSDAPDKSYNWSDKYSPQRTFKNESLICLLVKNNQKSSESCDKVFIVWAEWQNDFWWEILSEKDPLSPLIVNFSFQPKNKDTSIASYLWTFDDNTQEEKDTVEHSFLDYWKHSIKLELKLANGTTSTIYQDINIQKPLDLSKPSSDNPYENNNSLLRITDKSGKSVIEGTYKRDLSMYHLKVWIPLSLDFDASYVKVDERTYDLSKVEWDFNEDWKFEKSWEKITYSFLENKKYTILAKYTFVSKLRKDTQSMEEKIVVEADKKDIDVQLSTTQDSDYAPTVVHFDWSASQVKEWIITKFTYDFWEWKATVDGDAKQDYKYRFPWEYIVEFTVTKDDWTKQSIKKKVILKEKSKDVIINTSVSSGIVWKKIDFDSAGSIWQIDTYNWDFWDWSRSSEPTPSHEYAEAWSYQIKLTLTFADWVIKYWTKNLTVK
ncbi:MAG: hypothetical protein ACD_2C00061G0006 [uncultured bacterium (gcode 4)]|uniref:PKD domain-containing protein n=1 Tax=uncultured bacterium (gcode 4) TaxID=1234023 RepID=K2FFR9_9BACT|nr:MAG: hypothetical protein ACD_2C00061G0006 [uncultured bacterium (gcode 4)]